MSESKWTKGPWAVAAAPGGWDAVREPGGLLICSLNLNNSANAPLIAAAPELYEALRVLMIEIGEGSRKGRAIDLLPRKTVDAAIAALAKARGE